MAKKSKNNSNLQSEQLPKVYIEPSIDESTSNPLRVKEIQELVAEIIILGTKRGKKNKSKEELKNVA